MFQDNSDACKEAIRQVQVKWLKEVGELLVSAIKPLVPVDTSKLKNSISYKVNEGDMSVIIGTGEDYAIYVEFGTGEFAENGQGRRGGWVYNDPITGEKIFTYGEHPKPYMRPGYRGQKKNIQALLEKCLKDIGANASIGFKKVK
ncbi:hypothetical protein CSC2_12580 [Clostridium zeae]|uniref:HK97 gp10 family phage protein n=1 Tax=Clostridium zeae TaxID=2759022 RepID=A0ABQ1E7H4_9CLOT|nr:HK97-gp10 family putative phage morphogenesis protein [Clostridium zeae]GFZ30732.1 hypothetical protein CSC2_12580 [Clostridium zeae]